MIMAAFVRCFAAAVTLVLSATALEAAPAFKPDVFRLANGLEVVVIPDHRAPVAVHMVWYRVGAADEPPGVSGIAHFLEHLMFRGTDKVPPGAFSKIVAKNGGQDNAFTTRDYTAYFQSVAVDRLPLVMELEADRMRGLKLTPAIVDTERKVILEERRTRIENDPSSLLGEQLQASLFMSHPYGIPVIGWEPEMAKLSQDDALSFYRRYYAPNNAILIVAGDVTGSAVRALAERYYGGLAPNPDLLPRKRPDVPPQVAPRRVVLTDARAEVPTLSRHYLVPSYTTARPGEAEALDVAAEILGGGPTSRLYRALVVEGALASNAGAWYSGSSLNDTTFGVFALPRQNIAPDVLEAAVDKVISEFLAEGPTAEELKRAKTGLVAASIYVRDSQFGMARMFGEALTTGATIEDVLAWPTRIERVKAKDVTEAVRRYLVPVRSATGLLLPANANGTPRAAAAPVPAEAVP